MYCSTFYSFKGGSGRTMALVNTAAALASRGRRVLLVDFDLEAPGIDTFPQLKGQKKSPGVVDFVESYLETNRVPDVNDFVYHVREISSERGGGIWVMPAGRRDDDYGIRYQSIDWQKLYAEKDGYLLFEDLKLQWEQNFAPDYVLIDSRTGHSDIAGICTRQLPDSVVVVFFPSDQHLQGLTRVVEDIRAEARSGRQKKIDLLFVASNVPTADDEEDVLRTKLQVFSEVLQYERATTLHHYASLAFVTQGLFVLDRPRTSIAREYLVLADALTRANPHDREGVLYFLRHIRMASRDRTNIEERLARIKEEFPEDGEIVYRLGEVRERQGLPEEALACYQQAVELGHQPAIALGRSARLRMALGRQAEATENVLRLLELPDVEFLDITSGINLLMRSQPQMLKAVVTARAFRNKEFAEQVELLTYLLRHPEGLTVLFGYLQECLEQSEAASEARYQLLRLLVVSAIGTNQPKAVGKYLEELSAENCDPLFALVVAVALLEIGDRVRAKPFIEKARSGYDAVDWVELDKAAQLMCEAVAAGLSSDYPAMKGALQRLKHEHPRDPRAIFDPLRMRFVGRMQFNRDIAELERVATHEDRALRIPLTNAS